MARYAKHAKANGFRIAAQLRGLCTILIVSFLTLMSPSLAWAQSVPPPATHYTIDANGVDVIQGLVSLPTPSIAIGQAQFGGLGYFRVYDSSIADWRDNVAGTINSSGSVYTVTLMGASESFTLSGGSYTSNQGMGATLTLASGVYTYTTHDGTVALYDTSLAGTQPVQANVARVTQMTAPDQTVTTFTYTTVSGTQHRLQSVTNNLGYQLSFTYDATNPVLLAKVTAINNAVEYCSPTANGCTLTNTWPSLTFANTGGGVYQTVTDALSRTTKYTIASGHVVGVTWPDNGTGTPTRSFAYYGTGTYANRVEYVTNGSALWTYTYSTVGTTLTTTITDPTGLHTTYVSDTSTNRLTSVTDHLNHATSYLWDSLGRQTRATLPEGNYTELTYDSRGNVTQVLNVPKSGSGLSNTTQTASFDTTCSNRKTCNQPNSTTDARGFRTDYTYDTTHGGILTVTQPGATGSAPVGTSTRPQTRYSYTQLYAWYKNSGGSIVQGPSQVYRLTATSACATSAWSGSACTAGNSDETKTTIGYGTGSSSVALNLLPLTVSRGAGDGSLTATVTNTYSNDGDVATTDGPLSGTADTTLFHYDDMRQRTGIVGPDPDAGGSLHYRALRYTYDGDGQVTKTERGWVAVQTDWGASFHTLEELDTSYNGLAQRIQDAFAAGGTTYNVTQYSYDTANRLQCTAVRMNPAVFGSLPSSACTLGTEGSNGPDRITKNVYDQVNRITQVINAYGTSSQQTTATQTWSNNNLLATLKDANNNLTTYIRDGFDRVSQIQFPSPTTPGTSNPSDYEGYGYDANSNVTSDRRRDGTSFTLAYDNLNQLKTATAPAGTDTINYLYDLFGRQTQASTTSQTLTWGYDQLSRNTSAGGGPGGTVAYQYDLAGDRTQITWPGTPTFYVTYDYDATGAVTTIKESGTTSLATYAYDDYARRTSITRGNGVTTTYNYDSSTRLSSLVQDLSSTPNDQTLSYSYNASNQILTRAGSNSAYAWPQPSPGYANYTTNGLNQYPSVGGTSFSYDTRGNLTSNGTTTYSYDAYNRMTSAGTATLSYDPASRLYQTAGASTTRFLYDGQQAIAEYNSSNVLQRRYVFGPGVDEPIVWYEGSGTTDRRYLIADEEGSIIAITANSGDTINSYDEYGQPASGNVGRFQFTGQMWLPEATVYHFKAREYVPNIGRFAQSDPLLSGGGLNLYAYVENDPVNNYDPPGWNVYLVSRSVFLGLGQHAFIIIAPSIGAQPTSVFSYAPAGNIFAAATFTTTLVPSINSPSSTRSDDITSFVTGNYSSIVQLDFTDTQAEAAGELTNEIVSESGCTYDPRGEAGCNSNTGVSALLKVLGGWRLAPFGNNLGWDPWWRLFVTHELPWGTVKAVEEKACCAYGGGGGGQQNHGGLFYWWWAPSGASGDSRSVWFHFPGHG